MKLIWILGLLQLVLLSPSAWCAKAKLTIHVVDEFENPIVGAPVQLRTWVSGALSILEGEKFRYVNGVSDANGNVTLSIRSKYGDIGYHLGDEGSSEDLPVEYRGAIFEPIQYDVRSFYRDGGSSLEFDKHKLGKWLPWNPTVEIRLRPIIKPVKMYARSIRGLYIEPSEYGRVMGFDLMESDWVAPFGEGKVSDFILQLEYEKTGEGTIYGHYYDATLHLAFLNDGDGIQHIAYPVSGFNDFRLPRKAPEVGYESDWKRRQYKESGDSDYEENPTDNYFFRVRTVKDEKGSIVSALYGKIEGPIRFGVGRKNTRLKFNYYLNPNPNDRNLEYGGNLISKEKLDIGESPGRPD